MARLALSVAEPGDIPALERMHAGIFGEEAMTRWMPGQLARHLEVFPEGQFVVRLDGEVVASASSLRVPVARALDQHTWMGITGGGDLLAHDPGGGCLYGMEIMVAPEARGLGIAPLLYRARKVLARELDIWGVALGGRLCGLAEARGREAGLTAGRYVQEVAAGKREDPVLCAQMASGFRPVALLPGYLRDPEALDHAALMVWCCDGRHRELALTELGTSAPATLGDR